MERITVSLPDPQMSWLKGEAKRLGVSSGELLRRIIDQKAEHSLSLRRASPQLADKPAKEKTR